MAKSLDQLIAQKLIAPLAQGLRAGESREEEFYPGQVVRYYRTNQRADRLFPSKVIARAIDYVAKRPHLPLIIIGSINPDYVTRIALALYGSEFLRRIFIVAEFSNIGTILSEIYRDPEGGVVLCEDLGPKELKASYIKARKSSWVTILLAERYRRDLVKEVREDVVPIEEGG